MIEAVRKKQIQTVRVWKREKSYPAEGVKKGYHGAATGTMTRNQQQAQEGFYVAVSWRPHSNS